MHDMHEWVGRKFVLEDRGQWCYNRENCNLGGHQMAGFLLILIYLSFISLGLPDAMLGSAWPIMHPLLNVPVSYMGLISVTLSLCTVVSSLMADRINRRFGTALVTAASTAMTALALVGISFCNEFWGAFMEENLPISETE